MPKYRVTATMDVAYETTIEAESADQAKIIAFNFDGIHWKEYDGDYDAEITVEEIDT